MIEGIILDEKSFEQFKNNIIYQKYMICWCYYDFYSNKNKLRLDVCHTKYIKGEVALSARGICYFSLFNDESIHNYTVKELQKYIHSFIEIKEPKQCQ